MSTESHDTTTPDQAAYLTVHGWYEVMPIEMNGIVLTRLWRDPISSTHSDMPTDRAVTIQRARDSEEERRAFDGYFAAASAVASVVELKHGCQELRPMFSIEAARDRARKMIEYRREAFSGPMRPAYTIDLPPRPCTGAGTVPPAYFGVTGASSTAFSPAPCGLCGQVVAVDGHMRTVTHPYKAPAAETPVQED